MTSPAPRDFLPSQYDVELLLQFTDYLVRCQQGSVMESMNYIAPYVIEKIRRNSPNPVLLAKTNRAYRALKLGFPDGHAIWRYVHNHSIPRQS